MRKRLLIALVAVLLLFGLVGCGKSKAVIGVEDAISRIGEVSLDSIALIEEAENSYQSLSEKEQSQVANQDQLYVARKQFDDLVVKQEEIERLNTEYLKAEELFARRDYNGAISAFSALGDFKDSEARVTEVEEVYNQLMAAYEEAESLLNENDFDGAIAAFNALGDFSDSAVRAVEATDKKNAAAYMQAEELLLAGDYDKAAEAFAELGDYEDSADRVLDAKGGEAFFAAFKQYENEEYMEAADSLIEWQTQYTDTLSKNQKKAIYQCALALIENSKEAADRYQQREKSYRLLSLIKEDPAAAELLEQFIWRKTRIEGQNKSDLRQYEYDEAGRLVSDGKYRFTYGEDEKVATETDITSGDVATYVYDAIGQLIEKDWENADGSTAVETWQYDDNGLHILTIFSSGDIYMTATYDYDDNGNRVRETVYNLPWGIYITEVQYDDSGKIISCTLPTGKTRTYEYDDFDNLIAIKSGGMVVYQYYYEIVFQNELTVI